MNQGGDMAKTLDDVQTQTRVYSDWSSTKGLRTDILPWRLWDKGKRLHWDPADIDFTQDTKDWEAMTLEQQLIVAGLARGFMVGEEGVTLDIMPLVFAMADEGRAEETMFLTQFCYEEAKHVDFFNRWFTAVGADPLALEAIGRQRMRDRGVEPPNQERPRGLFEYHLPLIMRRLLTDRSPEAFLDASVTYNQFIEGCLAIAGYRMWSQMFDNFGVLAALREGIHRIQDDERRHIAYGTFLCRRLIAARKDLAEVAVERMYDLRDMYTQGFFGARMVSDDGDGNGQRAKRRATADEIIAEARAQAQAQQQAQGNGGGGGYGGGGAGEFSIFAEVMLRQVDRRVELLRKAAKLEADAAERGVGAEELEEELEKVS
jgi:ribonucleoside-diphosphate reductase beta chain